MCCISVRFLVIEPPEVIEQDLVLVSRWLCLAWQGRFLRFSSKDVVGYCQPGHLCVCVGGVLAIGGQLLGVGFLLPPGGF